MAEPSFLQMLKDLFAGPPVPPPPGTSVPRVPPRAAPPTPPVAPPSPVEPPPLDLTRVPANAAERVATIQTLIDELRSRAEAKGVAGSELAELTEIGTVYLPRLLRSYAEIPPEHRSEIFRDTGRSASFLLIERLDRIVDRLREMSREFARGHIDAFSQNMRFIDLRYGPAGSPFD